jgi:hypothetical protein
MVRILPTPTLNHNSDSTSGIIRGSHSSAGTGQQLANRIQKMVVFFPQRYQTAEITWVKGHARMPGNEGADAASGKAAGTVAWSPTTSLTYMKLQISEKFRKSNETCDEEPRHWRSAIYFKRTRQRTDDRCRFCEGEARMTRSHALLHFPDATLVAARVEAWEGRNLGGVRVLLANPSWESRLLRFLELFGVGMCSSGLVWTRWRAVTGLTLCCSS